MSVENVLLINKSIGIKSTVAVMVAFFFIMIPPVEAQNSTFKYHGSVYNDDSVKLTSFTINVKNLVSNRLMYSEIFKNEAHFSITLNRALADSFFVEIWHQDYLPTQLYFSKWPEKDISNASVFLKRITTIDSVIITPPQWQSGDTTFFRADAFIRKGDENLQDVLRRLPGFYINTQGELFYLSKKVAKLKIDGAELFADQINLLITNIPQQALDMIQAIQNETESSVLKGLDKDISTNINITTKKNGKRSLTGNITLKCGTDSIFLNEYQATILDPVGKVKKGYIGNVGNTASMAVTNSNTHAGANFDLNTQQKFLPNLNQTINFRNVETSDYLRNRIQDHHLQFTIPLSKKTSYLEIKGFLHSDKITQSQKSATKEVFETKIQERFRESINEFSPHLRSLHVKAGIFINPRTELFCTLASYSDQSADFSMARLVQDSSLFLVNDYVDNDAVMRKATVKLNKKIHDNLGLKLQINVSEHELGQNSVRQSSTWDMVFNTSGFGSFNSNISNRINRYNTQLELLRKNFSWINGIKIDWSSERIFGENLSYLYSFTHQKKDSIIRDLTSAFMYKSQALSLGLRLKSVFGVLKVTPSFDFGFKSLQRTENGIKDSFQLPTYNISLASHQRYNKRIKADLTVRIFGNDLNNENIRSLYFPESLNSYARFAGKDIRTSTLAVDYHLNVKPSSSKNYFLLFNFSNSFFSPVSRSSINMLLSKRTYQYYARPSQVAFVSNYYSIFFKRYNLLLRASNRIILFKNYTVFEDNIVSSKFLNVTQSVEFEKGLNFPLILKSKITANVFKGFTPVQSLSDINRLKINWCAELNADFILNKSWHSFINWKMILEANAQTGSNNFLSINTQRKFNKRNTLIFSVNNLLNNKRIYSFNIYSSSFQSNSYTDIPGRAIFLSYKFILNK